VKLELAEPLVEEAVRLALAGRSDRRRQAFHRRREACYAVADPAARDAAFRRLYRRYFLALGLERSLLEVLAEYPELETAIPRCRVAAARRAADEGAELYVAPAGGRERRRRRLLALHLRPGTLAEGSRLRGLLRRELLHVADMIDPAFGYRPQLPASTAGPVYDQLVRERYAALWSASVIGRLLRRGRAEEGARAAALERVRRVFGPTSEALAARLLDGPRPTHGELLELARAPAAAAGAPCPLCRFPSAVHEVDGLEPEVVAAVRAAHPRWRRERGLCPRCADLYRARAGVFARPAVAAGG